MRKLLFVLCLLLMSIQLHSQNYSNWVVKNGTSSASVDSLNFGFISYKITIINDAAATDTLFVSYYNTFPDSLTFVRIGGEGLSYNLAWTKLYYKFGTTPTAGRKSRIEVSR